ncbi:MAG: RidA family protein [Micrococcales bacterium]|nr:RidA family protein [Micrococcales bacterium]
MTSAVRREHPDGRPRPYAASVTKNGVVYACGQVPVAADGSVPAAIGDQVRLVFDNLERVLEPTGASLATLLKVTVYLADLDEFDDYNEAYLRRLSGLPLPPRTTVQVARFRGEKRIELEALASTD